MQRAARRPTMTRRAPGRRAYAPTSVGTAFSKSNTSGFKMSQLTPTKTMIVGRSFILPVDSTTAKLQPTVGGGLPGSGNGVLGVFDVNPTLLGDRVSQIAATFEKYVYKRLSFKYIPQCSTGTAGSIALCFDRDPNNICANPQSTNFLAQVMSYENAALTPAWQHAEVTYYREKSEKKLYYIGGQESNIDTRTTSQGNLIVYASNVNSNTNLGFIVCDYVLELNIPNILPKYSGASNTNYYANSPSQYTYGPLSTTVGTMYETTKVGGAGQVTLTDGGGNDLRHGFESAVITAMSPGTVGEIILAGNLSDAVAAKNLLLSPSASNSATGCGIRPGDKLYFCVTDVVVTAPSAIHKLEYFRTLPEALAFGKAASPARITDAGATSIGWGQYLTSLLWSNAASAPDIRGWYRILNAGDAAVSVA